MIFHSQVEARGPVPFPEFKGERHYMVPFRQEEGLPDELSHWQPTVDAMLSGYRVDDFLYLMVDQKEVEAGVSHRRPGIHVDGYWVSELNAHGGGHAPPLGDFLWKVPGTHRMPGRHRMPLPDAPVIRPRYDPKKPKSDHFFPWSNNPKYPKIKAPGKKRPKRKAEAIILASDLQACAAYKGFFITDQIGEGGDCSHVDVSHMDRIEMEAGRCYSGNVTMLHESLPFLKSGRRTVVRLNAPGLEI